MAIDIEAMRAKLKASREGNRGGSGNGNNWRPDFGDYEIRVLPTEDNDPFKQLFLHYGVGKGGILCPRNNFSDDCPICAFATKLYKSSKESGDQDGLEMAKQLFVKDRYYSPIIIRGEESEGVKVWSYSKTLYEELLEYVVDPDYGDITHLDEGFDIKYSRKKVGGKKFPEIKIKIKPKATSLCGDLGDDKCKELLSNIPDFTTLFPRLTTEQVAARLEEHLNEGGDAEENSSESSKYGNGGKSDKTSTVDEAFNDLMDS